MGQNITKTGHVTLTTTPLGAICHHRLGFDTVYLHAKSDDSSFSHSRGIIEASKFKLGHVFLILTTRLMRVVFYPYAGKSHSLHCMHNFNTLASAVLEIWSVATKI